MLKGKRRISSAPVVTAALEVGGDEADTCAYVVAPQSLYCRLIEEHFREPLEEESFGSLGGTFLEHFGVGRSKNRAPGWLANDHLYSEAAESPGNSQN